MIKYIKKNGNLYKVVIDIHKAIPVNKILDACKHAAVVIESFNMGKYMTIRDPYWIEEDYKHRPIKTMVLVTWDFKGKKNTDYIDEIEAVRISFQDDIGKYGKIDTFIQSSSKGYIYLEPNWK